ncbi:unnamed protein product [Triticum turgidum subsp. durum]|uniref:RNase H type-1 domain-containing protein n=1 Tax=Triticum turgidum subsp. durum TaxID=4567 RepID=A0A9R1QPZ7_TRITD|nr:unnamed protein product [Triticum turgidum subsp. durum]
MILRDSQGSIILSSCRHLFTCADVLEAELLAIKEGISLALQWIYLPIDVESDCSEAISMIKEGVGNKKKHAFIIKDIIDSMEERDSCISHTRRNCNNASHFMATFASLLCRTVVWLGFGPEEVVKIIR